MDSSKATDMELYATPISTTPSEDGLLDFLNPPSGEQNAQQGNDLDQTSSGTDELSKSNEDTEASASPSIGIDSDAPTYVNDDSPDGIFSEKISTAPEPPRWRFINEAKKSLGYSSQAAGTFIKGLSSDVLGANYVSPDVSLYQHQKKEKLHSEKVEYQLPIIKPMAKEDVQVGKLEDNAPPQDVFSSRQHEVGKILFKEGSSYEAHMPYGEFAGLPRFDAQQPTGSRDPFKEWDTSVHLEPKKERDHEWYDGDIYGNYNMPGDDAPGKTSGEVGKLGFHGPGSHNETFVGEIPRGKENGEDGESEDSYDDARYGALFMHNSTFSNEGVYNSDGPSLLTEATDERQKRKNQRCLYLLLLLLLLLVIILAVLVGSRGGGEIAQTAGVVTGVLIPPVVVAVVVNETSVPSSFPSEAPSDQLSLKPSTSPSTECPWGTKSLSISHLKHSDHYLPSSANGDSTWKIKDACSGEVIAKCLPCSLGSLVFPRPGDKSFPQVRSNGLDNPLKDITECLHIDNEYVFEVLPAQDSEPCCGFDHTTSVISYDNVLIKYGVSDIDLFSEISNNVHFGERGTPCESDSPSISPSISASAIPSMVPSQKFSSVPSSTLSARPSLARSGVPSISPSFPPTPAPSTSPPTKSPVSFLGGCPRSFELLSYYTIGSQIESNGIIYECISYSCGSYGFEPGSSTSSLWRLGWDIVGSCVGTKVPTPYPTTRPTTRPSDAPSKAPTPYPSPPPTTRQRTSPPTNRPTPQPTCSTEQEFNLCLAVDMSGSICNDGTGSECLDCRASFLPFFFSSECKDTFVNEDTCCNNFANVKEFSSTMVNLLDDFDAEKSFSVVQFSTTAQLVSSRLSSAELASPVIDQLDYTGGLTNHASAIQTCQESLPSFDDRKNFIMLITDGVSSEPGYDPEGAAESAALSAKADGTFIIPVFISPYNDWSALAFMRRLSSDGKVFDVTDFDSLNSLQGRLIDQVSCS